MASQSRKKREREQHLRSILQAAEEVFARKGFHGATVQEIADRAEFSVGYLYTLFAGKQDLYVQLVELRAAQFMAELRERVAGEEDVLGKIRVSIEAKFDFFRRDQQFFHIFTHMSADGRARGPVFIPERCQKMYRDYLAEMRDIFAEGVRRGVFVDVEPMSMALCMEGMTRAILAYRIFNDGEDALEADPELVERMFLRGVLAEGTDS